MVRRRLRFVLVLTTLVGLYGCSDTPVGDTGRAATADEVSAAFLRQFGGPNEVEGDFVTSSVERVQRINRSLYCIQYREHWQSRPEQSLARGGCWDAWRFDGQPVVLDHPGDKHLSRLARQGMLPHYVVEELRRSAVLDEWAERGFPQPPPAELYQ